METRTVYRLVHGRVRCLLLPAEPQPQDTQMETKNTTKPVRKILNRLTMPQKYKLADQLKEWKNELHETRMPFAQVAERAATALQFHVTDQNVYRALKDLDILYKPRRKDAGTAEKRHSVHRRLRTLETQVDFLKAAFHTLCERIGEKLPPQLSEKEWPTLVVSKYDASPAAQELKEHGVHRN